MAEWLHSLGFRVILLGALAAAFLFTGGLRGQNLQLAGQPAELSLTAVSENTLRVTVTPRGSAAPVADPPVLVPRNWPAPFLRLEELAQERTVRVSGWTVRILPSPLALEFSRNGQTLQRLVLDGPGGAVSFRLGNDPLLGLGGGAQQFDRRGGFYPMDNGHRPGEYQIFGSRVPVPFLISTEGWALLVHRPYRGAFDLRGPEGKFQPVAQPSEDKERSLPLDLFLFSGEPGVLLSEYVSLTGRPVMPPRWALGYIQSHRTLQGPEEVLQVARTFRQKELPCDVLIYLGTGYTPSGWNTGHGSLDFNPAVFNRPAEILRQLRSLNFKVILHVNRAPVGLHGGFDEQPPAGESDHVVHYWARHREVFQLGVDGWWPDDGDELPVDARLARHLTYYQGPLQERPGERPFSLHRTGYAGMQRYGGWVWSGDVYSLWDTLAAHVPVGINFSLSASPFWGTDIGGFFPTRELTGELYTRWFQFGAFCPIFRSHGRAWHTRLPWGWNTGELGPDEIPPGRRGMAAPDPSELRNPEVEPICKEYLQLRYRLMPYLYTLVREAYDTGMPIMRALWLHYPEDPQAVRRGDQYLWGRDFLVAPVVRQGVTHREVYLPEGLWYDFWSNRPVPGRQQVTRYVDLWTIPLYVRAGAVIPFAPLLQYTDQPSDEPLSLHIYPGEDGQFTLYEDDGRTLDYQEDLATWTRFSWNDAVRELAIAPNPRSRQRAAGERTFQVLLVPEGERRSVRYRGEPVQVRF